MYAGIQYMYIKGTVSEDFDYSLKTSTDMFFVVEIVSLQSVPSISPSLSDRRPCRTDPPSGSDENIRSQGGRKKSFLVFFLLS